MFSIRRLILSGAALVAIAAPAVAQNPVGTVRDRIRAQNDTSRVRRDTKDNTDATSAQSSLGRGSRGRSAETPAVLRGLDLTTAQRSRINALFADYRRDVRALRGDNRRSERASSDARRNALDTRTQRLHADIRSVLTAEQRARFDSNIARARQGRLDDDRRGRRDRNRDGDDDDRRRKDDDGNR